MTSFNPSIKIIPAIVIASAIVVSIITVLFTQAQVDRASKDIIERRSDKLIVFAGHLELSFQNAIKVLEFAARQDEVRNMPNANSVSEQFMGIPPDFDLQRRQVAKDLLAVNEDFETASFILPNGDVYFVEPYAAQQALPGLNFAFRDWYQGAMREQSTYIGEAVVSAATGNRVVPVVVPVYSDSDGDALIGLLVGAMSLKTIQENLRESNLGTDEYILVADHKSNLVADSREQQPVSKQLRSVGNLKGVSNALGGDSGWSVETIDDTVMLVHYRPFTVGPHKWAIISVQPYEEAFFVVNTISYQSFITVIMVALVSAISGYFLFLSFRSNSSLTRMLEKANEELKNQANKLLEVDREKEEFSAMITHELKTPLVPIIGYSELLMDGSLGELTQKQREKVRIIHESATSLLRLISDLLDVRKLELGQMKFNMVDGVLAKDIIEQSVNVVKPLAQEKGVVVDYKIEDGAGELKLRCDPKRIQQVLHNLLTNGIKFVPEHTGKIEVSVQRNSNNDGSVLFAIKDNGIGIPEDKQQNLFKKFYQVDTSLSRNTGGTGLGLAISKGIVEAHGGKIWFESKPRTGSTFYFTVPSAIPTKERKT